MPQLRSQNGFGGKQMIHAVKIAPDYFDLYAKNLKPYEVRQNDRDYRAGDYIALNEYKDGEYTGRCTMALITYVFDDPVYCPYGYVILTLEPCDIVKWRECRGDATEFRTMVFGGDGEVENVK